MTVGEERVLADARSGEVVDLSYLSEDERVVSADAVRRLCVGPDATGVDPRGIMIRGAHVPDHLDLAFSTVPHPIQFRDCTFAERPRVYRLRAPALAFWNCALPGLDAGGIEIEHVVGLAESRFAGELSLLGARIGSDLNLRGAALVNPGGTALLADGLRSDGNVDLGDAFYAEGAVSLLSARVGRDLICSGTLANKGAQALLASRADIGGLCALDNLSASGAIDLQGARIGGDLQAFGARFANRAGDALSAAQASVGGGVLLGGGFGARGTIDLSGATIARGVSCAQAKLTRADGAALTLFGAEIGLWVALGNGFRALGTVDLTRARVGRGVICYGASFHGGRGAALDADAARIDGDVLLVDGSRTRGAVGLRGTRIEGNLKCSGALLEGKSDALVADGAQVAGDLVLGGGLEARGAVRLKGTSVGGSLECADAVLGADEGAALLARDVRVDEALVLRDVRISGGIDLYRASATTLDDDLGEGDDGLGSWAAADPLVLDGFAYERFADRAAWDPPFRLRWLRHTTRFEPGSWRRLADVYRAHGRDEDATRSAIAMQDDRVARGGLRPHARLGRRILRATIGYGYRSWLAGVWALGVIVAFALVVAATSSSFVPAEGGDPGGPQPLVYAADTFLPIVDFDEADRWTPTGWVRWPEWAVILLGWTLSTIFVAGFTRIVRDR